jgi:uncharacterized protein YaiI (UPF0178 family)
MRIWVDANACPKVIKEILFRASERVNCALILVANQPLRIPRSRTIQTVQVPGGFDAADDYIAQRVQPGDLVITADIPLAATVIEKHGHALNPRGDLYTKDNIRQQLAMRDFMEEMRNAGQLTGGPPSLGQNDRRAFANELDRFLSRHSTA